MNENLNKNEWIDERMIDEQLNQMDWNNTEATQYSLKHTGQVFAEGPGKWHEAGVS